jgi:hypothetical protein
MMKVVEEKEELRRVEVPCKGLHVIKKHSCLGVKAVRNFRSGWKRKELF